MWMTSYPPPAGFDGYEEGEWGDDDYRRSLSPEEQAVVDANLEAERAEEEAGQARELDDARGARDRFFGFTPVAEPPRQPKGEP